MQSALSFFRDSKFPPDFHRAAKPSGTQGIALVLKAHPIKPGFNADGKVNNYVLDPNSADFGNICKLYEDFVMKTVKGLYPNPKGILRRNLIVNLHYMAEVAAEIGCKEVFPYGKD